MVNGIYSAAFCESAALRKRFFAEFQRAEPSQSSLRDARFPLLSLRDIFPRPGEVFPLRGSFISAYRQMRKSSPFGRAGAGAPERVCSPLGELSRSD